MVQKVVEVFHEDFSKEVHLVQKSLVAKAFELQLQNFVFWIVMKEQVEATPEGKNFNFTHTHFVKLLSNQWLFAPTFVFAVQHVQFDLWQISSSILTHHLELHHSMWGPTCTRVKLSKKMFSHTKTNKLTQE
jgi:hypothetical protein